MGLALSLGNFQGWLANLVLGLEGSWHLQLQVLQVLQCSCRLPGPPASFPLLGKSLLAQFVSEMSDCRARVLSSVTPWWGQHVLQDLCYCFYDIPAMPYTLPQVLQLYCFVLWLHTVGQSCGVVLSPTLHIPLWSYAFCLKVILFYLRMFSCYWANWLPNKWDFRLANLVLYSSDQNNFW